MGTDRRELLAGGASLLALTCCAALAAGPLAAEPPPVEALRRFIVATAGRDADTRRRTAQAALDGLTPSADATLLVEIAAIGVLVRGMGTRAALGAGYLKRSRAALARADELLAGAAWTHALHGAWHYEVVRRSRLGAMVYGASRDEGDRCFNRARQLDPRDGGLAIVHAASLLAADAESEAARALRLLRAAPVDDDGAYGTLIAREVRTLVGLLAAGQAPAAARHAETLF